MNELYKNMGFIENPFSTFTAEDEKEFLKDIYIYPLYYQTLKSDIEKGHSRFIFGSRGIGKTALILQIKEAVQSENIFAIIIDDFEGVPQKNNEKEFIKLIIEEIVTAFSITISKNPRALKKLNSSNKQKLSFIIKEFFKTISKSEYERIYNKIDNYKTRNFFRWIWNYIFNKPINILISSGVEVAGDTVRKSLGLPNIDSEHFYKNYIPELSLEEIKAESPKEISTYKSLKKILNDLSEIIKSTGFKTIIIFFDKIDEYTSLSNNIKHISVFLSSLLKDTTVLTNNNYAFVFSIWDVLKPDLTNNGVRFDKLKPVNINWNKDQLKSILEKRIIYFSNKKLATQDIIPNNNLLDEIISLANHSPRYLFKQLSYIYDQQAEIDSNTRYLSDEAIIKGQIVYAKNFEYYSIYPGKRGLKDDILNNINRLLRVGKIKIKTKDFVDTFKVSTPTAISYIKIVKEYNLVKELEETENGAKIFEIIDPVIRYLINNGINEIQK